MKAASLRSLSASVPANPAAVALRSMSSRAALAIQPPVIASGGVDLRAAPASGPTIKTSTVFAPSGLASAPPAPPIKTSTVFAPGASEPAPSSPAPSSGGGGASSAYEMVNGGGGGGGGGGLAERVRAATPSAPTERAAVSFQFPDGAIYLLVAGGLAAGGFLMWRKYRRRGGPR